MATPYQILLEKMAAGKKVKAMHVPVAIADLDTNGVHVSALPDEILDKIFRLLHLADRGRAAQVCQSWKKTIYKPSMCSDDVVTFRMHLKRKQRVFFPVMGRRGVRHLKAAIDGQCDNKWPEQLKDDLKHFPDLRGINFFKCYMLRDRHLLSAAPLMAKLTSLDLSYTSITDAAFCDIAGGISGLHDLTLEHCSYIGDRSMEAIAHHLHRLRRLTLTYKITDTGIRHLTGSDEAGAPTPLPGLEYLNIGTCHELTDLSLQRIVAGFPRLSELIAPDSKKITANGYAHLAVRSSLKKLDLSNARKLSNDSMYQLAGPAAAFTSLNLYSSSFDYELAEPGVRHLVARMRQLEHLALRCSPTMGDGVASELCLVQSNIRSLSIHTNHALTDHGLQQLSALDNLRVLYLDSCQSLTNVGLAYLATERCKIDNLTLQNINNESFNDNGLSHLSQMTNLSTLRLIRCHHITGTGFSYLAAGAAPITTLTLDRMDKVLDEPMQHLTRMPHLRHLILLYSSGLTDKGLGLLADGNLQITSLEVKGCDGVGRQGLAEVAGGQHRPQQPQGLHQLRRLHMERCCSNAEGVELAGRYLQHLQSFQLSGRSFLTQAMGIRSRLKLI